MTAVEELRMKRCEIDSAIASAEGMQEIAVAAQAECQRVAAEVRRIIVGQSALIDRLLVALVAGGHVLVEGAPGLAKTLALKTLGKVVGLAFSRVQFTPDLLPSDLVGTRVYNPRDGFSTELGPIHANLVLADEINRAPAKTQSALLEAMAERQVTIGKETFSLEDPFLVLATQNPIEQEGTYDLPEAQLDRFLMKVVVDYPSDAEELGIVQRISCEPESVLRCVLDKKGLLALRQSAARVFLPEAVQRHIVQRVASTRRPHGMIQYGASPRCSLALASSAKARALMSGRIEATCEDVDEFVFDCMRHRIVLSTKAVMDGARADDVIRSVVL